MLKTYLYPNIIGYFILIDEPAHEVEVSITGSGVCDFNFFQSALDELLKEKRLLWNGHWICQRLIPIAQICR